MLIFVRMLVTVTVALGIVAPEGSRTAPVIVAVSCWAYAVSGTVQADSRSSRNASRGHVRMAVSPDKWEVVNGDDRCRAVHRPSIAWQAQRSRDTFCHTGSQTLSGWDADNPFRACVI